MNQYCIYMIFPSDSVSECFTRFISVSKNKVAQLKVYTCTTIIVYLALYIFTTVFLRL